jgi:hypothetical protein
MSKLLYSFGRSFWVGFKNRSGGFGGEEKILYPHQELNSKSPVIQFLAWSLPSLSYHLPA